jgi:phenylacetic acid degradation operon negative regulatory protein
LVKFCNIDPVPWHVTPKNLVLDLFRVAPEASPAPVAALVDLGRTFGFAPSSMRAAVSRLTSAGLLESDARGWYRPAPPSDPFRAAIESWREGEARVRPWNGEWLALACGGWPRRAEQRRTERALRYMGFRPGLARLWLRPDNLALARADVQARLAALGASGIEEIFTARGFSAERIAAWSRVQWDTGDLEASYAGAIAELDRCLERLDALPTDRALVETFVHGGHAIRLLALDPLLPAELVDAGLRRALFERMTEYDRRGRARWHARFGIGRGAAAAVIQ